MIYNLDDNIRVKMFGNVSQPHGKWHNGARPANHIVLYCTEGEIHMKIENELFHVEAGDLLLIPKKTFYQPLDGGSCRYYFLHFEVSELHDIEATPSAIIISHHTGLTDGYGYTCITTYPSIIKVRRFIRNIPYPMKEIFQRAAKLRPNASFTDQLLLDHLLRELLIFMGEPNFKQHNKHLIEIMDYIDHHYSEPLCLSALGEHFSLSPSYIARLFKTDLSCKPSEYINQVRISAAKTMLSQTNLTVTEIAERVGYSDVYYFSKIFKRIVGCSPLKARNQI